MSECPMKKFPLSVPMTLSAAGTALSLWLGNKRVHLLCGAVWLGISAVHGWQHSAKMCQDLKKGVSKLGLLDIIKIPKSKIDIFVRSVEVSSFIPGRIRLYSNKLVSNKENCDQVLKYLQGYAELREVEVSDVTGSILIKYDPQILHHNKELTDVEEYIKTHVKRR